MAAVNGTHTPPDPSVLVDSSAPVDLGDKKRKREASDTEAPAIATIITSPSRNVQIQEDILDILEQHDTNPSFLKHAIERENVTAERSPKKPRLSNASSDSSSIASKLSSGAYNSLDELRKDAERVGISVISSLRDKAKDREGQNGRSLVADLKQIQRVQAFEQVVKDVVRRESEYNALRRQAGGMAKKENGHQSNGVAPHASSGADNNSVVVLTLPGNAPTAKQLFSSGQSAPERGTRGLGLGELGVDQVKLPIGIRATRIDSAHVDGRRSGSTFESTFAAPYNLPTLHPPRVHRRSTNRDETIKWEFRDATSVRNRKGGYTVQSLPVAEWLGYGGPEPKDEPSSPQEKRKLRDRTLSSGETSQPPPSKASLEESLAKEEEALFRRAYSSFAPSCDNSKAIVPEEVKSMVWWHKVGEKRYQETFAIDPALLEEPVAPSIAALPPAHSKEDDFSTVVEDLEALEEDSPDEQPARDKTNIDEVLREISELLHTLSSFQRIRNASLQASTSADRTPISPAPSLASRSGRPDGPGDDEFATYEALRREIVYLVLQLPPYAVAKINGDQLAELGVSKLIKLEHQNVAGSMEEDQVARLAKFTAQATAQGLATLNRSASGSQHYSSTNQRAPAIGQAANTRYGQTLYGLGRTPMSQPAFNRSLSNQTAFNSPSASAVRPGFVQSNQYSRPGAPQSAFAQQNGQQYSQQRQGAQGTPGLAGYNQYNNGTPTGQHQRPSYPTTSSQPLAQFQQRSHAAAQNAVAYQTNQALAQQQRSALDRSASPLKPASYQPPLQPSPVPRAGQQFPPPAPVSGRATPIEDVSAGQAKAVAPPPQTAQSWQANGHV